MDCEGYDCGVEIRAKNIKVGDGSDDENTMESVVSQGHFYKIRTYIEVGKEEAKLVFGGNTDDSKGFFY
ncbi:aldehyde dehydrogenase family protein [Flavobacterium sp.]|uniref:aldehyde dehydrogenase family protein n=1 Tax=Flavobacterium sp. TaxID=239 RepID=UPI0022C35D5B|nr:aldehyde dehydrogenase family protein [Flavobacterium sp.]MCZ8228675.1 aldehyde dehydrogenase family protein [Flavobacterium sp.]